MTPRRDFYVSWRLALILLTFLTSCDTDIKKGEESECSVRVNGAIMFVGTRSCMQTLPRRDISGIWVLGHEYSVFYPEINSDIPAMSYNDIWLDLDVSRVLREHGVTFDGNTHAYAIKFIGTYSDKPGMYGSGMYKRGALAVEVTSLKRLPDNVLPQHP